MEKMSPENVINMYDFSTTPLQDGNLAIIKMVLVNYYNAKTLKHHEETGSFLNPLNICLEIPSKIKELYVSRPDLFTKNPSSVITEQLTSNLLSGTPVPPPTMMLPGGALGPLYAKPKDPPARRGRKPKDETGTEKKKEKKEPIGNWIKNPELVKQFGEFVKAEYVETDRPELKFKDLLLAFAAKTTINVGDRWNQRYEDLCKTLSLRIDRVTAPGYTGPGTYYAYLRLRNAPPSPTINSTPVVTPAPAETLVTPVMPEKTAVTV